MQIDKPNSACTTCEQNFNCSSCLKTLGCGWCYDSNNPIQGICTGGDFSKPFIGISFLLIKITEIHMYLFGEILKMLMKKVPFA